MKKINIAWLPYLGAIVQAGLFALAGSRCFGPWGWLIGCGVGAVVNLSLAVASSRISEIAQKRQPLARLALFGMFLLSPTTITLSLYVPSSVFTSIAWAASPDLAIVLAGAIAGKGLVDHGNIPGKPNKVAGKAKKLARKTEPIARKHVADNELLAYLQANPGASQQKVADHFGVTRQAIGPRVKKLYEVKQ